MPKTSRYQAARALGFLLTTKMPPTPVIRPGGSEAVTAVAGHKMIDAARTAIEIHVRIVFSLSLRGVPQTLDMCYAAGLQPYSARRASRRRRRDVDDHAHVERCNRRDFRRRGDENGTVQFDGYRRRLHDLLLTKANV